MINNQCSKKCKTCEYLNKRTIKECELYKDEEFLKVLFKDMEEEDLNKRS